MKNQDFSRISGLNIQGFARISRGYEPLYNKPACTTVTDYFVNCLVLNRCAK
jgi:hypothetical protein